MSLSNQVADSPQSSTSTKSPRPAPSSSRQLLMFPALAWCATPGTLRRCTYTSSASRRMYLVPGWRPGWRGWVVGRGLRVGGGWVRGWVVVACVVVMMHKEWSWQLTTG